MKTETQTG